MSYQLKSIPRGHGGVFGISLIFVLVAKAVNPAEDLFV